MSAHWRLAFRYAAWVSLGAALAGVAIWLLYGEGYAGSFLYGVGVGIASFVSTAFSVSMLTGRSKAADMVICAASFVARYGFVAVALGVPAYLGLWAVAPMLIGCAGVYLAENAMLLPGMVRVEPSVGRAVRERVERRVRA
ncbi:MAG: hypothetical protein M3272_04950 [Actinomycetota bacterium]|nr:hypothetical protein [Actinomycetota bacterium]